MAITPRLDIYLNYNDPSRPVLVSAASLAYARGVQVVGGENVTMRVYFVNATGASPSYVVPVEADTIRFTAKKQASDEELVYLFDSWTISGTYIETTADFATVEGFWANATEAAKSLISNIEVETAAGLVRKWSFFTQVVRQSYGGEAPPVNPGETYVKYTEQDPTPEQQAQARANIGAGTSSFDPASPGPIGGTTPGVGTFSSANLGTGGTDDLIVVDGPGGTVIYSGSHSFRGGATFGTSAEAEFTTGGALSVPSLTIAGNTLALGGENVTFGTFGASFVQSEGASDARTALELGVADDVTFGSLTISGDLTVTGDVNFNSATTANFAGSINAVGDVSGATVSGASGSFSSLSASTGTIGSLSGVSVSITDTGLGVSTLSGEGAYGLSAGLSQTWGITNADGSASFASGSFSVSATGDMTATHGKFQGAAGVAGHIQLKQGTTPNGTANETTIWGISGGIGWRNGTGTAYSLTLPSATGTIGVLASSSEALAGVNTANVMTPALSALQDASPIVKDGFSGAGWTQYTSPTGGFATSNTDFGVEIAFGTATGGTGRYTGPGNTAALYVGKGRGVINWSKPGAVSFLLLFYSVELDAVSTFRFGWGKTSTGLTWGDPSGKYIGLARTGTNVLRIQTHNGTTLTNTNTTFTPTLNQAAFVHLSWDGAGNVAITVNGTSYGTATGAPTGDGSSTENRIIAEGQNASTATLQGNVQVSDLALTRHMF